MEAESNKDLQLAYDFVKFTNRNIFLTGRAGTGKTTFLHQLKKSLPKRMVVLAPTGVAAINAGGVTIHSFFQLPFHPYIPHLYLNDLPPADRAEQSGYKMSRMKINIIRSLDLLVIDEISMVRADLLDAIDAALRKYRNRHLPFGGVQLLLIGDLQQLAPVAKDEDRLILDKYYDILFFFGSLALKNSDYITIELKHIYRQNDLTFINLLNKIRENQIDEEVLNELDKRYIPDFDTDSDGGYITLTTHNNQSNALNVSKLENLKGKPRVFKASVKDDFPEIAWPNVGELTLKTGAQVMFVKNDISGEKLFFNGKIGKVESFEDDTIIVSCPGEASPIRVEMAEWQNMKYTLDEETKEIQETVIGTFTQYPLRLAWAITIHKSQGLTFDRAVIDARAAFAHGQVYVALSRCRTLDKLVLSTRINNRSIIDNPSVSGFIKDSQKNAAGPEQLAESKRVYRQTLLEELFNFSSITRNMNNCLKVATEHKESLLGNPTEVLLSALSLINSDIVEISDKFRLQLLKILNDTDEDSDSLLQERLKKAGEYFLNKLETALEGILDGFTAETDNKAVRKSFDEALERLRKEARVKQVCLKAVLPGFKINEYLDARAKAEIEDQTPRSYSKKRVDMNGGTDQNHELFMLLKEWRNAKASELDLPHYMILHQKTITELARFAPDSMGSLMTIKGMGKKKSAKFGEEILEIIDCWSREKNM